MQTLSRRSCGVVLTCFLGSCLQGSDALTEAQRKAVLDAHNKLRGQEGASDMPALVYDLDLEASAQKWTDKCTFLHAQADYMNHPDCGTMEENFCGQANGENFGMSTATDYELVFATNDWYSEKPDWTYTDGKYDGSYCDTTGGKMCGHYTQVVSKQTRKVGCALKLDCTGHPTWKSLGLCQYDPPGNINTYFLFNKGTACSQCEIGYDCCEQNVCFGAAPASPVGEIEMEFLGCQSGIPDMMKEKYTTQPGTCFEVSGDMNNPGYKLEVVVVREGDVAGTGRSWGIKRTVCSAADCSSGCLSMGTTPFDECPSGSSHKFTWKGDASALVAAPGTLTSGAVGSCSASSSGGSSSGSGGGNGGNSGNETSGGGSSGDDTGGNSTGGEEQGNGSSSTLGGVSQASGASRIAIPALMGLLIAFFAA